MRASFLRSLSLGLLGLSIAATPALAHESRNAKYKESFRVNQRTEKVTRLWENVLGEQQKLLNLNESQGREWQTMATAMGGIRGDIASMGKMKGHLEKKGLLVVSHNRRTGEKRTLGFANYGRATMIPSTTTKFATKK